MDTDQSALASPQAVAPILRAVGLHKSFGSQQVLRGIDLDIPTGQITVIIGGSGSGKSVLIKHLVALLRPDRGEVQLHGSNLFQLDSKALLQARRHFGMLFQSGALFDSMSVYDNVAFPLREHENLTREDERRRVFDALDELQLADAALKFPAQLSGGMKKRVALARATILRPQILIYDEPTTGLDPLMTQQVDDLIAQTQTRLQVTSVVISHDMASTFRLAHQIAMLYEGRIVACGSPAAFRASRHPVVEQFLRFSTVGTAMAEGQP